MIDKLNAVQHYIEATAKFVPHTHDMEGCDALIGLRSVIADLERTTFPDKPQRAALAELDAEAGKLIHALKVSLAVTAIERDDALTELATLRAAALKAKEVLERGDLLCELTAVQILDTALKESKA